MSQGCVSLKEVAGHLEELGPHPEDNGQSLKFQAKECHDLTWVLQQAFWLQVRNTATRAFLQPRQGLTNDLGHSNMGQWKDSSTKHYGSIAAPDVWGG